MRRLAILAAMIGGLLIGARRSSCKLGAVSGRPHPGDSPGDRMAQSEATLESLERLYDDKRRAQIVWWRIEQLRRAGFDELRANTIAATDVDWHRAIELVKAGCDHVTAANIVL